MDLVPWFSSCLQKWFLVQLIQGAVTAVLHVVEYLLGWQASSLPQATAPFSSLSSHASINKPTTIIPGKSVAEKSIRHSGILKTSMAALENPTALKLPQAVARLFVNKFLTLSAPSCFDLCYHRMTSPFPGWRREVCHEKAQRWHTSGLKHPMSVVVLNPFLPGFLQNSQGLQVSCDQTAVISGSVILLFPLLPFRASVFNAFSLPVFIFFP